MATATPPSGSSTRSSVGRPSAESDGDFMETQNSPVISVIGLGYIGLPTAAMFASRKVPVVGVDVNPVAVATINDGRIHIVEPELDMIVHAAVEQGYLRAVTTPEPADAFLIAVPTPLAGADRHPDTHFVERAA